MEAVMAKIWVPGQGMVELGKEVKAEERPEHYRELEKCDYPQSLYVERCEKCRVKVVKHCSACQQALSSCNCDLDQRIADIERQATDKLMGN
jgi:hypothetical protein